MYTAQPRIISFPFIGLNPIEAINMAVHLFCNYLQFIDCHFFPLTTLP